MIYPEVLARRSIYVSSSDAKFFKDNILVVGENEKKVKIFNEKIVEKILNDNNLFANLKEVLSDPFNSYVKIAYKMNGDEIILGRMSKSLFTSAVLKQNKKGQLAGVIDLDEKVNKIKELTSLPKNDEELFEEVVDGKTISVSINTLNSFILGEFKKHKLYDCLTINGIDKKEFLYVLKSYVEDYDIANRFYIPIDSREFLEDVKSDVYANTQHFNRILDTVDPYKNFGYVCPELYEEVTKNMRADYSPIEKAIYIYAKLCRVLTYDPCFYATNQNSNLVSRKLDADAISQITPDNPQVVCFEVNHIYSKFLQKFGINYEMDYKTGVYGDGHANLTFRVGEYIITADTVSSILGGDLVNAKLGKKLNGLVCENKNNEIFINFTKILNSVYADVKDEVNPYMGRDKLDALCSLYKNLATVEAFDLDKKIGIIKKHCEQLNLPITDRIASAFDISKKILRKNGQDGNSEVVIMSETIIDGINISRYPILLIKVKINDRYDYYTYNYKGEFVQKPEEELKKEIFSGKIAKIGEHSLNFEK